MKRSSILLLCLAVGCPEAAPSDDTGVADTGSGMDTAVPVDSGGDTGAGDTDTADTDTGADAGDSGLDTASDAPAVRAMAINEINPAGDDWMEVVNISGVPLAAEGFTITQLDDAGMPEIEVAAVFPELTLAPGEHFFILLQTAVAPGVQTECVVEGVEECLFADFGISGSRGDTLVILDPAGAEAERVVFPPDGAPEGGTFGRFPDATGEFMDTAPTPVAANVAL